MNQTQDRPLGRLAPAGDAAEASQRALDDSQVIRAVKEYQAGLLAGARPDRQALLARFPGIADALAECLDGLEFVHAATPDLSQQDLGPGPAPPPPAPEGPAAVPLGDYRILREVGRGGMGVVYEAEQLSLGRRVALKVLPFAAALDAQRLQRFKTEAQAAAQLHHTSIVPVYGVGCERGVHFYAMQFIDGHSLAAVLSDLRQQAGLEGAVQAAPTRPDTPPAADPQQTTPYAPPHAALGPAARTADSPAAAALSTERSRRSQAFFRAVARLGLQAAEALEHAHQLGVVHRDVKPANLLLDGRGNLWITDFGLARLSSDAGLTMTGDLVGTLRYMSPEQALAKRVPIDHRTDVYSLGVTLYELLTLEPAFPGADRQELLRQIAFEEPRPPRRLDRAIPQELETVVLKAMAKNPNDRYATAQELADDLRRFIESKPIRARRPGLCKRTVLWVRRRPALAGLLAASGVAAVALLALGLGVWVHLLLRGAYADTELARQKEAEQRQRAEKFQYFQHIALAEAAWQDAHMGRLEQLLDECLPDYQHTWEWRYLKRQCHTDSATLTGHTWGVTNVAFSPDGTRLATTSFDGTVKLWDVAGGRELYTFRGHQPAEVYGVAFSPDGKRVASASADRTAKVWEVATGALIATLTGHTAEVYGVAFSPDGKRIATASWDTTARVWDATTGREVFPPLKGHTAEVFWVAFSPDGKRLATASWDRTARVWDAATGREVLPALQGHAALLYYVAFSPDGKRLATASQDKTVRVWDAATGALIATLEGHTSEVDTVVFSPDGKRMASAGADRTIKVWDAAAVGAGGGSPLRLTLKAHANMIFALAFSPDGSRLASVSQDRTVKFWDATTGQEARSLAGHSGEVTGVAFSPDGGRIASAGADGTVKVWDAATGQPVRTFRGHTGAVAGVAFSPDGTRVASAGADRTVRVWEAATGRAVLPPLDHTGEVRCVVFNPDGKQIASGDAEGVWTVWQAETGQKLLSRKAHDGEVRSVAYSADGTRLASAGADRTAKIWDATSAQVIQTLEGHHCWCHGVAFSGDATRFASAEEPGTPRADGHPGPGARLASVSGDGTLRVWDAASGAELRQPIEAHGGYVRGVAFGRDGTRLATASMDGTVKLWDVSTGQEVLTLRGHASGVTSVAFSPDGDRLVSGGADGAVKVWDARPWTPDQQVEREALGLLDFLFARPMARADVLAYLRDCPTVRPETRARALALAERYGRE
jgi:WD40 repeat protein/serine/threonine protein kinase